MGAGVDRAHRNSVAARAADLRIGPGRAAVDVAKSGRTQIGLRTAARRSSDRPRAHHRARAAGREPDRHAAALPYEVRSADEYFDEIQEVKLTKDMLDLAKHIVNQKSGHFEPG